MTNRHTGRALALIGVALSALMATDAGAQTTDGTGAAQVAPTPPAVADSSNEVQEIVVTANKREQSLNDVGLTVSALSSDMLKDRNITSLEDLTRAVPSFSYSETPGGIPALSLRGVGYNETSLAAYPTVSLYLDEVPFPFPVLSKHANFDLERVEVLKGPQGTLFGQNATAGAVNFIAAKPTDEFRAGISLGYGRFNAVDEEAYVSGPLSDTISARLSQRVEFADGWQKSSTRPGDRNGGNHNIMGRLLIDFHPSDDVKFLLNVNAWNDKTDSQAAQFIGLNVQNPGFLSPLVAATPFAPPNIRAADWNAGLTERNNSLYQISLRGDLNLSDDLTLTSLTAYTHYKQNEGNDFDGLPFSLVDYRRNDGKVRSFFQELRLANDPKSPFRWVLGVNYSRDKVDQEYEYVFERASSGVLLGIREAVYGANQKMRHAAVFVGTEFDLGSQFTLNGSARYTNSKQKTVNCGAEFLGPPFVIGNLFFDILVPFVFDPTFNRKYQAGDCYPINDLGRTINGVPAGNPGSFAGTLKESNVSWRGGIDWKPERGKLFYFNVSKGFKSGNFPTTGAATFSQYLPATQESVLALEGGFKLALLDRKVRINGAVFNYSYKDKQLRTRALQLPFGLLDVVRNVPKSTVTGVELEVNVYPTEGLTLSASGQYLDAKIDEFSGLDSAGVMRNFAGTRLPNTPKFESSFNVDYRFPISETIDGFVGAGVLHRSSTIGDIGGALVQPAFVPNEQLYRIKDYTLVDARFGFEKGNWKATVWGKNIFNTYYWNSVYSSFDAVTRYTGRPATYGVTLAYNY